MNKLLATTALMATLASPVWAIDDNKTSIDDVVIVFYEEPNEACEDAKGAIEDGELDTARGAVDHAAKFIALEAKYAMDAKGKHALETSYADLKDLNKNIESAKIEDVESVCAAALYNLAFYQHKRAEKLYQSNKSEEAGQALYASAINMRYAAGWANHDYDDQGDQVLENAENLSRKMTYGEPYSQERAKGIFKGVNKYLKRLNIKIEPPKFNDEDSDR